MNLNAAKEKLKYVFRTDDYVLGDTESDLDYKNSIYDVSEMFVVCGDHSLLKIVNMGFLKVCVAGFCFEIYLGDDLDFNINIVNEIQQAVMIYDYCVTELKKMGSKEGAYSYLNEIKIAVEEFLHDDDAKFDINKPPINKLSKSVIARLEKRCEYLVHAYDLEWRGVITLAQCKKFKSIEDLDNYIQENNLMEYGEGIDKRVHKVCLCAVPKEGDLLQDVRVENSDSFRYFYLKDYKDVQPKLKKKIVAKLNKELRQTNEVYKWHKKKITLERKLISKGILDDIKKANFLVHRRDVAERKYLENRSQTIML